MVLRRFNPVPPKHGRKHRNGLGFLAGESLSTMSNVAAGYLLSAVYDVDLHARFWLRRQKTDDMKEIFFLHGGDLAWS